MRDGLGVVQPRPEGDEGASYRDGLEEKYEEAPCAPWTIGDVLAGIGCLAGVLAFVSIRVVGVVALFD
ncbi:hypothetical protein [Streptomyces virginiae]|uniref:hypothetical protein n=1 Tax=Streptomyces virginiae TaxID=1961 RepID=UPI00225AF405|nr:hypothetical protein [Streptomyces virginiae]MCX4718719.1 hypothetical protein [Streptomyces virginiae]MCX5276358.1 hypothetical protein [Streptomyces virginiae]